MIKIIAKNGKYHQEMRGDPLVVMCETQQMVTQMISQKDGVKAKEKLIGFAVMLGISKVFNKSEMLELLHDACEDKLDEIKMDLYITEAVHALISNVLKGDK